MPETVVNGTHGVIRYPNEYASQTLKELFNLEERSKSEQSVYPTGLHQVDNMIEGGFMPGTVTLFAARSNAGKSAIVQSIARGLMCNHDVIVLSFCLDDSVPIFYARLLASVAKMPISHVQQAHKRTPEEAERLSHSIDIFTDIFAPRLFAVGGMDMSLPRVGKLVAEVYDAVSMSCGARPQVVAIVDSTRNIDVSGIAGLAGNTTAATEYMGKKIKEFCGLEVNGQRVEPIFLVTEHLRKGILGGDRKRPTLDDLKDSIGPQYDANLIFSVWNDLSYCAQISGKTSNMYFDRLDLPRDPEGNPQKDPIIELSVLKSKMGRMSYNAGGMLALFELYQEQTRAEPILDYNTHMNYVNLI
jgi:hypothetical protein